MQKMRTGLLHAQRAETLTERRKLQPQQAQNRRQRRRLEKLAKMAAKR